MTKVSVIISWTDKRFLDKKGVTKPAIKRILIGFAISSRLNASDREIVYLSTPRILKPNNFFPKLRLKNETGMTMQKKREIKPDMK